MKKQKIIISLLLVFHSPIFFGTSAIADSEQITNRLMKKVESSRIARQKLGLIIADHEGKIIFKLNEGESFIPASVTKIVTAAAVLERLPVGHQFVTELLAENSQIQSEVLKGNLYMRGGGDAGFVSESMWFMVNEFLRSGVKQIQGDLVIDDSRFDRIRFDESRDQSRVDRAYDAPIGAMTFNWSAANVFVRPGAKVGEKANVFIDPASEYFVLQNEARTVSSGKKTKIEVSNRGFTKDKTKELMVVSGEIPVGAAEFVAYKSVGQPEIWAGEQLKQFLLQRGVQVSGRVKSGKAPAGVTVLAQNKSKPVADLVTGMMKFSNNYIAEILTKNLAAEQMGSDASLAQGVELVSKYLREKGLRDFTLINPSGLSRKNKFKPQDLLHVLRDVQGNFKIFPEYLAGLPLAGVDGTLKRRLGNGKSKAQVRAKTGHLSGVAGLAGYASDSHNNVYSFVFLYNGSVDEAYASKDLFDQLLNEITAI